jgi:lipoic acid synthetase
MRLAHVVVTMVTRDDLPDGGASHLAGCVRAVREEVPGAGVEVLASDLGGDTRAVATVMDSFPDVFGHNLETVERLSPAMRPAASYARSLGILRYASARAGGTVVKSGLMAGLGEEPSELFRAMRDLRDAGVGILTVGQYLTPAPGRAPVSRFLEPSEFEEIAAAALGLGFAAVVSSPLARSSLNAREALARARGAGHARG